MNLNPDAIVQATISLFNELENAAEKKTEAKKQLFTVEEPILLSISLTDIPLKYMQKIQIKLPNAIYKEDCEILFVAKDDEFEEIKNHFHANPVKGLKEVMNVSKLQSDFKEFKYRRELVNKFDLIIFSISLRLRIGTLLGKTLLKSTKTPFFLPTNPISKLHEKVAAFRNIVHLKGSLGANWSAKVGDTSMLSKHINENIKAVMIKISKKIPKKYMKAIYLKRVFGPAIPVFYNINHYENPIKTELLKNEAEPKKHKSEKKLLIKGNELKEVNS
mmetsp:Transcript_10939/g.16298  ORF Transcript_10939/g.16298 Transcript_10939/m.16298 type:complete len:275 (+) Transcript_10939:66-890(+)